MALIPYAQFYRRHGVRRLNELTNPKLSGMDTLRLPRGSILHYLPQDSGDVGIAYDDIILNGVERVPMVEHITQLSTREGNPRNTQVLPDKLIRDYHRKYRRMRPVRKLESILKDDRTLIIENYAILQHTSRYTTSFFSGYYRWKNIQSTFWDNVVRIAKETDRQQYVRCYLPRQLPSLIDLKKAESNVNRNSITPFNNSNSLMLLDIWSWIGSNRAETPMGRIDTTTAKSVNLIYVEGNRWFTINLGVLQDWINDSRLDVDTGMEALQVSMEGGTDSYNLQKRFLRSLMTLFETRTLVYSGVDEVEEGEIEDVESHEEEWDADLGDDDEDSSTITPPVGNFGSLNATPIKAGPEKVEAFDLDEAELEADLKQLELIGERVDNTPRRERVELDLEEYIQERCNALADMGLLSGAEFRRLNRLAGKYKTIKNPYGEGTLDEFKNIAAEDLKIGDISIPINNTNPHVDKSFYNSSLLKFDSQYIEKVLSKDIVNAVLSVQKAGVIVTDYKVETLTDAVSSYEAHTVRLTPTVGAPTTVRFRVPKIEADGTFKNNGIVYSLRSQRSDLPIRKTSPTRVALTSYHSKLFIDRTVRSTNNYAKWLTNFIMVAGKSLTDDRITDLRVGTSLSHLDEVPFIYSTLGNRFRSFKVGEYTLDLDYRNREKHFGVELTKALSDRGLLVCGMVGERTLVVDNDDTFYTVNASNVDDVAVVGKIQDILPIDMAKAPVEFVEAKIFNRVMPVGLILGYWLGLEGLLKFMDVTPRRVLHGERVTLNSDEYALRFNDETLVFSREDRHVMLVLGGFSLYQKVIRNYSVYDFDRPEVYFNVMEAMGIGAHYVRELDTLLNLFVDPITKDLLVEMGEPTDLPGLLKRAAQLLLTDSHPREVDMEHMRIRGYERIAGAVYGEMVRSIRAYKSRPNSANSKVEMNPHAVWLTVMQDPSIGIVEEINPIQNLKEQEVVTFTGNGGRSTRSMMKRSRVYGDSDVGVISESTVDSSNVGVIAYTTADPNFTSIRGTTRRYDKSVDGPAKLLSTTALLMPCSTLDDRHGSYSKCRALLN